MHVSQDPCLPIAPGGMLKMLNDTNQGGVLRLVQEHRLVRRCREGETPGLGRLTEVVGTLQSAAATGRQFHVRQVCRKGVAKSGAGKAECMIGHDILHYREPAGLLIR